MKINLIFIYIFLIIITSSNLKSQELIYTEKFSFVGYINDKPIFVLDGNLNKDVDLNGIYTLTKKIEKFLDLNYIKSIILKRMILFLSRIV